MKPSKACIELLHAFEGFVPRAYPDPKTKGPPITIGYGFTYYADGSKVQLGDVMTMEQADELLEIILPTYAASVFKYIPAHFITQNRLDAATSWLYNLGSRNFANSSFMRRWRAGDIEGAADALTWWISPGTRVERGLRKRRAAEQALFLA